MIQFADVVPMESIVRRAPLALRLMDTVFNQQITDQLVVTAYRLDAAQSPVLKITDISQARSAERSRMSGLYGFASLDGLSGYEWDRQPASDYCPGPGAPANYAIVIQDVAGRFLPQTLALCLPNATPQDNLFEVDLFSTASRLLPDTFGVIRAELWDISQGRPAAWAVMKATFAPNLDYVAVADARGVATVFVPYPPPDQSPLFGSQPIFKLTWPYAVQVHYAPSTHKFVQQPNGTKMAGLPPTTTSILNQETLPPVTLIVDRPHAGPDVEADVLAVNLAFRADLIVKTRGNNSTGQPLSRLLVKL